MQIGSLFGTARTFHQVELGFHLFLDNPVGKLHRRNKHGLRKLFCIPLDHDDLVRESGVDQFQRALLHLGIGRVRDELPVDIADAQRADRAEERQIGKAERDRGAKDAEHVSLVFAVRAEEQSGNLDFIEKSFREKRAQRAVRHAADQDLLVARTPFAFDVSSGETPGGGIFLPVVHLQRKEILTGLGRAGTCGDKNRRVAETERAGTVCEPCDFPRGNFNVLPRADVDHHFFFGHNASLSKIRFQTRLRRTGCGPDRGRNVFV